LEACSNLEFYTKLPKFPKLPNCKQQRSESEH
jgi:hypothetical protein